MKMRLIKVISLCAILTSSVGITYASNDINILKDIDYLTSVDYEDNRDKLDVYLPKSTAKNPILVHFHGGGLLFGSKDKGSRDYSTAFAKQGLCVVAPNYRLAPQHKFPAQVEDAVAAIYWAAENMKEHNCDTSNIYISGHSAGAYLVALMAVDSQHLLKYKNLLAKVKGVVPISPLLDLNGVDPEYLEKVWGDNQALRISASPMTHVAPNKIPMLILYGDSDHKGMDKKIAHFFEKMKQQNNNINVVEAPKRDHKSIINHIGRQGDVLQPSIMAFIQ